MADSSSPEPDLPPLPSDDEIEAWPGKLIELPPTTTTQAPVTLTVTRSNGWVTARYTDPHLTIRSAE